MWWTNSLCTPSWWGTLAPLASTTLSQVMSPNDYHISETTELLSRNPPARTGPRMTLSTMTSPSAMALSSPLFTQEREDAASRRRAYHSQDEGLSSSQSSSVGHGTGRPVVEQFDSLVSNVREDPCRSSENEQIRILLERQDEQILADCRAEIQRHEFQADYDRRNIKKIEWSYRVSKRRDLSCSSISTRSTTSSWTIIGTKSRTLWSSKEKSQWDERIEAISSLNIRYNFDEKIGRRSRCYPWTHRQDSGITEWNYIVMNDSRDFQDAESVRSGQSHVTSQPVFFPPFPDPGGMLSRSLGMPSRKDGPPSIWDTHGISGNVFANPNGVLLQHFISKGRYHGVLMGSEHTSPHVMKWKQNTSSGSEMPVRTVSQKFSHP